MTFVHATGLLVDSYDFCTCNRTVSWRLWLLYMQQDCCQLAVMTTVHATGLSVGGFDFCTCNRTAVSWRLWVLYMQQDCQLAVVTSCTRGLSKTVQICKPIRSTSGTEQCNRKSRSLIIPRLLSYFCSWGSIACYKRSNKGVTETARLQWKSATQYYFTNFAPDGSEESYEL